MSPKFGEIAGIENGRDITRGYVGNMGLYIPTQDKILNLKSGGDLSLYEQVAQDDRVKSCLQQRFAGLTSKEIEVIPGGDKRIDKQAAEHLKIQLERLNWDNTTEKMQWGVFYGYSVAEMLWGKEDDKVIIQAVRVRNRRRFKFGIDQLPRLVSFDNPMGEVLPEQKFWHFCCGADHDDEPYGLGLAHWLYWLTWFKRNDLRWWITFLENFADPSTLGTYPAGATPAEKATLEGAVRSLGKSKWAIKPEGMLVELVEASRSGTADYEAMYKTINEAISQVILSQNMTTESGSSESQARVHQDVGDTVIEADDALISGSFNAGPAKWLTEWNFPGAAIPIVRRKLEPEEDLKASAERDKIIVDMGFPANPEYIVEKYGEGFKPIESEATPVALNGPQLQAFVSLITQAQQGGWSPEMVRVSLQISFPHVPDALLDKMSASMKAMPAPGVDPNNPQPPTPIPQTPEQSAQSLDDVAAQFAGAPGKKNCKTGLSCGGSCISKLKICDRELDGETKAMVAGLRKRIRMGDSEAVGKLDKLRESQLNVKTKSKLDNLILDLDDLDPDDMRSQLVMESILKDLLDTGLPIGQAILIVGTIKMPRITAGFGAEQEANLKESAIDFLRLTNGVGAKKLNKFVRTSTRAYAEFEPGLINVGFAQRSDIFHEMGHFAEDEVDGSVQKNTDWVKSRATGPKQSLRSLTGLSGYAKTELAYPDKFYKEYVGKTYPKATEVLSMGLEKFINPSQMLDLWKKDRQHFMLVVDFLKETRNVRSQG